MLDFHRKHKKLATVTAVRPLLDLVIWNLMAIKSAVLQKNLRDESKGGLMEVFSSLNLRFLIILREMIQAWELKPLEHLARDGELYSYRHMGFWQSMDTLREQKQLEALWQSENAPWIIEPKKKETTHFIGSA